MTEEARKIYLIGLKNAHAMENQALSIMRPQLERLEHYPDVQRQLDKHIGETEGQIARLDQILEQADEDASSLKDSFLSAFGSMAALGHVFAGDEVLKNSFANFAFENYEIAAYKALIATAEANGETAAAQLLQQNLEEEKAMASWLDAHLPEVTEAYLARREAGHHADV